jgi:hypothetical protein
VILGKNELDKLPNLFNVPLKITAYKGMRNSDPKYRENSRLGVFVIIEVTDTDGTTYDVSVGNSELAKVVKLNEAGAIPQKTWSMFVPSTTKSGQETYNLVSCPDPTAF